MFDAPLWIQFLLKGFAIVLSSPSGFPHFDGVKFDSSFCFAMADGVDGEVVVIGSFCGSFFC